MAAASAAAWTQLEDELKKETQNEQETRQYLWLDECHGVSWDDFSAAFPHLRLWLFTLLDVTKDGTSGWAQLGLSLGLSTDQIEWCGQYGGVAGPSAAVFARVSSEKPGLSLHALLHQLRALGRHDLMCRIPWHSCVEALKGTSKGKQQRSSGPQCVAAQQQWSTVVRNPRAPPANKPRSYACSIMLLYTQDTEHFAKQLCAQLRRDATEGGGLRARGRVGVLVLEERRSLLMQDPHATLYTWFSQVDYIVPVLSPTLLREMCGGVAAENTGDVGTLNKNVILDDTGTLGVTGTGGNTMEASSTTDGTRALHHRYLFRLTLDEYVSASSRNLRCRPVCPANLRSQVCGAELVQNLGLLQVVTVCDEYSSSSFSNNNGSNYNNNDGGSSNSGRNDNSSDMSNMNASVEKFAHLLLRSSPYTTSM